MKHAQLFWLIGLGIAACLTCSPKASAQGQTVTDDGLYTLYTYVDTDGSNVYANSWFDEDLGGAASADEFTTLLAQAYWQLSDGSSSTSGPGESFSSAVSPGSSAVVTFNYIMYYSYFYVPEGPPGGGGLMCQGYAEDTCYGFDYPSISTSVGIPSPPPLISSLAPSSVNQGDQGTLTITGSNFIENSEDQLQLSFSGSTNPFTLVSAPSTCTSSCTATYSYDFTGYPTGTYRLYVSNNEASSEPVSFTVLPAWPVDPCAVGSTPKTQYSSFVSTGGGRDSGTVTVTFSGAAYSAVSQTVPYGPYSTPSSIAAHIASLVTTKYFQYGLTARAFGPNVVYNGDSTIGTVNHAITGTSFTTNVSSVVQSTVQMACMLLPSVPSQLTNPCSGANPLELGYNDVRWPNGETVRDHIINNHILETVLQATGVVRKPRSKYGTTPLIPLPVFIDMRFASVQGLNSTTLLLGYRVPDSDSTKIVLEYKFDPLRWGPFTYGGIGRNQANENVYTNHLLLTNECRVYNSYPVDP